MEGGLTGCWIAVGTRFLRLMVGFFIAYGRCAWWSFQYRPVVSDSESEEGRWDRGGMGDGWDEDISIEVEKRKEVKRGSGDIEFR